MFNFSCVAYARALQGIDSEVERLLSEFSDLTKNEDGIRLMLQTLGRKAVNIYCDEAFSRTKES